MRPEKEKQTAFRFKNWKFVKSCDERINRIPDQYTVPIDRILSVKNARAWVSMDFI